MQREHLGTAVTTAPGFAIVIGSMMDRATPTWHRAVYRTGTHEGRRWQRASTLCGLTVATVETPARKRKPVVYRRDHAVIRQDHAEQIGRECSRCAARHEEALSA